MSKDHNIVRSSFVFSSLTLISRFLGLARDLVITAVMGASGNIFADAYNTALQFPNLFRRIFAEGAFTAAFVPNYSARLEQDGKEKADQFARDALATLAAMTIFVCLLLQFFMPTIMRYYSAGFLDDPEKFKLTVILTQITMPYLPAMAIVALMSGILNALGRFMISALAPTLLNIIMIAMVWPQKTPEAAAYYAAWGVMMAGIAQVLLLIFAVKKSGARIGFAWPSVSGPIRNLFLMAIPGALAASATQINIFVSQGLSSGVDGGRSWMAVADRLYQLPLGLVGVAIGIALLPALSRSIAAKDETTTKNHMDQAILFALLFSFPAIAAILGMPHYLIDALFGRGEFGAFDVSETAKILFHYGWGVPAFVLSRIFNPAFFARKDTYGPMKFAMISVVANVVLCLWLFPLIGVIGLAIATSASAWLNVVIMVFVLMARKFWLPSRALILRLVKLLAAGFLAIGLYRLMQLYRPDIEKALSDLPSFLQSKELIIVALCFIGLFFYTALIFIFRAMTISDLKAAIRRKG